MRRDDTRPTALQALRRLLILPMLPVVQDRAGGCASEEPASGATLSDITDDQDAFYGRAVIVSQEVDQV